MTIIASSLIWKNKNNIETPLTLLDRQKKKKKKTLITEFSILGKVSL